MKLEYENVKVSITDDIVTIDVQTHDGTISTRIGQKTGQVVSDATSGNVPK